MKSCWGIDLGGTKIEGAVLPSSESMQPLCRLRIDTESSKGYLHIIQQISKLVGLMTEESGIRPNIIGVGTPGILDPQTKLMKNCNSTALTGKPFDCDLEAALGIKVVLENDANCFALAESRFGAARNAEVVFGVILGTGVGGGIVVRGNIIKGCQRIAGEWGHNRLVEDGPECYCGKNGCVEKIISGPALERYYSSLAKKKLSLEEISKLAIRGDKFAVKTIERLNYYFGTAISTVINILDPDVVVLGGGVSNIDALYSGCIQTATENVFNYELKTPILRNQLGDSAGVIGAALLT